MSADEPLGYCAIGVVLNEGDYLLFCGKVAFISMDFSSYEVELGERPKSLKVTDQVLDCGMTGLELFGEVGAHISGELLLCELLNEIHV